MPTSALPSAAETVADATPGTFASALSTAPEHEAHVIPETSSLTISVTPPPARSPWCPCCVVVAAETLETEARKPTPSTAARRSDG